MWQIKKPWPWPWSIRTSIHLYIHSYLHPSIFTSIHLYIHPSVHPFISHLLKSVCFQKLYFHRSSAEEWSSSHIFWRAFVSRTFTFTVPQRRNDLHLTSSEERLFPEPLLSPFLSGGMIFISHLLKSVCFFISQSALDCIALYLTLEHKTSHKAHFLIEI